MKDFNRLAIEKWDKICLKGKLITIRPLEISDENSLKNNFSNDLFEFYPCEFSDCHDFISIALKEKEKCVIFPWVFVDNKTGECIGSSSFLSLCIEHKRLELGSTWFGNDFQKKGFNVESKLLLLDYLFEKESMNRVELKTDEFNVKSNLAMQKLGCVKEGVFRKHFIMPSGRIRNSVYYSVISDEWPQTKKIIEGRLEEKLIRMTCLRHVQVT